MFDFFFSPPPIILSSVVQGLIQPKGWWWWVVEELVQGRENVICFQHYSANSHLNSDLFRSETRFEIFYFFYPSSYHQSLTPPNKRMPLESKIQPVLVTWERNQNILMFQIVNLSSSHSLKISSPKSLSDFLQIYQLKLMKLPLLYIKNGEWWQFHVLQPNITSSISLQDSQLLQ